MTTENQIPETIVSYEEIRRLMPHQYPMLLIDKVIKHEPLKHITAVKNITGNEHHMVGHFKERAVNPGVYSLESIFQTAVLMGLMSDDLHNYVGKGTPPEKFLFLLTNIEKFQFKNQAVPGDQLILTIDTIAIKMIHKKVMGKFAGTAKVGNKLVTKGVFSAVFLSADD